MRNTFPRQHFVQRILHVFLSRLRFLRSFHQLIVNRSVIKDRPVARVDADGFGRAFDIQHAGDLLRVINQHRQRILLKFFRLLLDAVAIILRIGIDHPNRHAAI